MARYRLEPTTARPGVVGRGCFISRQPISYHGVAIERSSATERRPSEIKRGRSATKRAGISIWDRMFGYFQFNRQDFLWHYHQRSNVGSTFSMTKARFGDAVRSKTATAMKNEVLAKFLCHNIVVVHQAVIELGIEPVFWRAEHGPRGVLRLPARA